MSGLLRHASLAERLRTFSPLWIIGALCALMAVHLFVRTPAFPYTPDSASYFEQTRNLLQIGAALETPYGLDNAAPQPSILFPIGYPVILALLSLPGIDPRDTALALSWSAGLLLPVLLFISFRWSLGARRAALLAGLTVLSPSVLIFSTLGTPDIFALLLAVATTGIVLNARSRSWLMFGGVIAGSAYAVRNAHLALLLSVAVYYSYLWTTQAAQRRETIQNALAFLLGTSLILLPVLFRNQILFGALNPYQMEPSTLSAIHNLRTFIQETSYDLSGSRSFGIVLGWSTIGAALILGFAAGLAWFLKDSWKRLTAISRNTIFLCTTYVVIGACVVIAARSRYEWGEAINTRHTLQYTPFLWAALLALLPTRTDRLHLSPILKTVWALIFTTGILHLVYASAPRDLLLRNQKSSAAMIAYENGKDFLCHPGNSDLTASNWGYVFLIQCGTAVRNIEMEKFQCLPSASRTVNSEAECPIMTEAAMQIAHKFAAQPIKLGFFSGRGIHPKQFPLSQLDYARLENSGLHVIQNDPRGILLSNQTRH